MRLLLDTCTFLWLFGRQAGRQAGLSENAREVLRDSDHQAFVSAVSTWEILVQHGRGRLGLETKGLAVDQFVVTQRKAHQLDSLPVTEEVAMQVVKLPTLLHDPFDRLLICQAIEHGLTLVTPDEQIRRYPIKTLW
jgi:PIN domain nuclease of toxin-antitoxin system